MAKVLNYESQIQQNKTVQSWHVSQSVDAFTAAQDYAISISGSCLTSMIGFSFSKTSPVRKLSSHELLFSLSMYLFVSINYLVTLGVTVALPSILLVFNPLPSVVIKSQT